jgi:glycosyltransferase involved in cell wall biosynthesis
VHFKKMSGRILYISYDGMTDPLGQSQVLPYLAGLSRRGYQICLLSCEKPERYEKGRVRIQEFCDHAGIEWHPVSYTAKPPILSTVMDIRVLKRKAVQLHRRNSFSVVHCRSYISAIVGLWMKRKFGLKFLFDMRGFWADERVDGGLWRRTHPLYNAIYQYFKKKEKAFLEQADAIVSLTHAGRTEILSWPLRLKAEITVIPCCVDTALFDPAKLDEPGRSALRQRADIPEGRCVMGYVGSLGTWYLLPEMLAFFRVWKNAHPDSMLFFVTTEPPEMIFAEAERQGVAAADIRVVSASRDEVPVYISLMNYGLFFLKQAFSKKASSPVKQGELMAMGVPVICNAGVGDSDRIVRDYHSGVLVHAYDEKGYRQAIDALRTARFDPAVIRAGCRDYFDLEQGIAAYEQVYVSLGCKAGE